MPAVEQVDVEKQLTDYLVTMVAPDGEVAEIVGWSVGTVVQPSTTPVNAIRVRLIGGVDEQRVADRPRIDIRMWGDGTLKGESTAKTAARKLLARLRRDFRCTVFASPIPLPDP